mgnify:CR=1 FL=1
MFAISASDVRKDWSRVIDSVIHVRPAFIKRTRDKMVLCSNDTVRQLVRTTPIAANSFIEDDGSVTLSMVDVDLVVNADTIEAAKSELINDLIEYAEEYYQNFELYSRSSNRNLPLVMKVLTAASKEELEDAVQCQNGKI